MPTSCALCGTTLHREEGEAVWRCANTSCPAKLQRGLEHFASRGAMNIEGLGESLIAQLLAGGYVKDYADLYTLTADGIAALTATSTRQDGKVIERRFGEKNAAKVVEQIDRSRDAGPARLLYGLGIRHVGERGAQVLADAFGSMEAIAGRRWNSSSRPPRLARCSPNRCGPGSTSPSTPPSSPSSAPPACACDATESERARATAAGPLTGKTYVLTGTLATMTREDAAAAIERLGGKVAGSVSKKTTAVVVGAEPGSKAEKARTLGLPVLDENAFRALIAG